MFAWDKSLSYRFLFCAFICICVLFQKLKYYYNEDPQGGERYLQIHTSFTARDTGQYEIFKS